MSTVTEPQAADPQSGFSTAPGAQSLRDAARAYGQKVRGGDVGALPAVAGLIALVIVFTVLRPATFPTAFNVANLINQSAAVIVIAMGLIFVLLLGEIDLSAGFAAGTAAAIMGIFMTNRGLAWPFALFLALLAGAFMGSCIGTLVSYLGIPSFVVTLAAFLGPASDHHGHHHQPGMCRAERHPGDSSRRANTQHHGQLAYPGDRRHR